MTWANLELKIRLVEAGVGNETLIKFNFSNIAQNSVSFAWNILKGRRIDNDIIILHIKTTKKIIENTLLNTLFDKQYEAKNAQ